MNFDDRLRELSSKYGVAGGENLPILEQETDHDAGPNDSASTANAGEPAGQPAPQATKPAAPANPASRSNPSPLPPVDGANLIRRFDPSKMYFHHPPDGPCPGCGGLSRWEDHERNIFCTTCFSPKANQRTNLIWRWWEIKIGNGKDGKGELKPCLRGPVEVDLRLRGPGTAA